MENKQKEKKKEGSFRLVGRERRIDARMWLLKEEKAKEVVYMKIKLYYFKVLLSFSNFLFNNTILFFSLPINANCAIKPKD